MSTNKSRRPRRALGLGLASGLLPALAARARAAPDADYTTYCTPPGRDTTAVLTFALPAPQTFDVLQLPENIGVGQRIEDLMLEYGKQGQ